MNANDIVSKAITWSLKAGEGQLEIDRDTNGFTLTTWRMGLLTGTGALGFFCGFLGGPVAMLLEAWDTNALIQNAGRLVFGVGHILWREDETNRQVDYENDLALVLALWSGASKMGDALYGKISLKLASDKTLIKGSSKIIPKLIFKNGSGAASKLAAKIAGKLATKYGAKIATKWIPVVGGVTSATINMWILNGLFDAAEAYYRGNKMSFPEMSLEDFSIDEDDQDVSDDPDYE